MCSGRMTILLHNMFNVHLIIENAMFCPVWTQT